MRFVSIRKLLQEKSFLLVAFVFLVTLLAFGLGYLAGLNINRAPIVIEKIIP
jgi:hypothetical protein